ncbi:MAG: class I SAM-dependent methyltransferase [Treponema sp.]|jgi:SAM-dependent methyltransferase/spore coat polysaccharide biosynthesis predicted glycosyltransferase SpsG|nr:class I SAM-dependent methyltransferase [Treponema sp.]
MKKVLLIPSITKNGGTGHLRRCARLLSLFDTESRILVPVPPPETPSWNSEELLARFPGVLDKHRLAPTHEGTWDYIIFDRRETSPETFFRLSAGRPAVGLDEGGPARPLFSFLIDTFPRLSPALAPNIQNEGLTAEGPAKPLNIPETLKTVLVTFGGEDPENLTGLALTAFTGIFRPEHTGIVEGPAFRLSPPPASGRVYRGIQDLRPLFENYDCVFTSFGISPYEALKAGRVPLLVNPGPYHEKLSRKAGFYSFGIKKISKRKLKKIQTHPRAALSRLEKKIIPQGSFASIFENFSPLSPPLCPICGGARRQPLYRGPKVSFFRCTACGISYREGFSAQTIHYGTDYFFEDYRRQYGKTYLEDFPAIEGFSRQRLGILNALCGGLEKKTLLDIGCAYGPFLISARQAGCAPRGLDIAPDAVRYLNSVLNIPAVCGDFLSLNETEIAPGGPFDIITLWFVIEHFRAADRLLRKAAGLLKAGGLLAFSTPNGRGVSRCFFPRLFFEKSPQDHYTIWDPRSAPRVLARFGLRIKKIRFTGHHPERFPRFMRLLFRQQGCALISRLFGLGDTFEVYAEKLP